MTSDASFGKSSEPQEPKNEPINYIAGKSSLRDDDFDEYFDSG